MFIAPRQSTTVFLLTALLILTVAFPSLAQQPRPVAPGPSGGNPALILDDCLARIDSGDYQEAMALFDKAMRLDPTQPKIKLVRGLMLIQMKKYNEALAPLQEFNSGEQAKLEWRGFAGVGRCCRELRWHRQAMFPLEQAIKLAPPTDVNGKPVRALITVDLATAEFALRQMKKAKEHTKDAENLSPNNAEVQLRVAELYAQLDDYPSAMKSLNRAIGIQMSKAASNPLSQKEYTALVSAYELKLQLCTRLRELKPKEPGNYLDAADAIRNKAEIDKRINLLQARDAALKELAADPKIAALHIFCAGIEMELGANDDALDRLNQVLRIDPSNADATAMRHAVQEKNRGRAKP